MSLAYYSLSQIRYKPIRFLASAITSIVFFFTPLMLSLVIREIFNNLEGTSNIEMNIWTLVLIFIIISVLNILFDVLWALLMFVFVMISRILLQKNIMTGLYRQNGALQLSFSSGEAISRFRGDVNEGSYFPIAMSDLVSFVVFGIIAFFIMLSINTEVTLFIFLPFTVIVVLIQTLRKKVTTLREERRKATGAVTGTIREIFSSIQAIKVASAEKNILTYFDEVNKKREKAAVNDEFFSALIRAFRVLIIFLATGIMLILIGPLMISNEFTIGDFALFIYLLAWVTSFINYLGESIARFHRTTVAYDRMTRLMKGENPSISNCDLVTHGPIYLKEPFPEIPPLIKEVTDSLEKLEVVNLTYQHSKSKKGIFDINFTLERGMLTVVTGCVGSGKTTLIQALLGLLPRSSGDIYWNGTSIDAEIPLLVPPRCSYTPQVPNLFSASIKDNILLGLPENSVDIEKALTLAVINDDITTFKEGLNSVVGPKGVKLSGGQKQRVAAARMIARDPELYVFDDLSSALDVETEERLWNQLFKASSGTFLVVSHRPMVLRRADNIIVLKDGRIEGEGRLNDLLQSCPEMKKLWEGTVQDNEE